MPISKKLRGVTVYPTEKVYAKIGQRIKFLREIHGITQVEMAAKIGMTWTSLTNIEAGRQRLLLHSIMVIAKVLHVKPDHLVKGIW